jgi:hypothetical protein
VPSTGLFNTRRIVISVILAAATALLFVGLTGVSTKSGPTLPRGIDGVIPSGSTLDVRQARIGVDLSDGYDGALQIDGNEVPDTELERVVGLNQLFYLPGPRKTIPVGVGDHRVTVIYWLASQSREQASYYSFSVHAR